MEKPNLERGNLYISANITTKITADAGSQVHIHIGGNEDLNEVDVNSKNWCIKCKLKDLKFKEHFIMYNNNHL